MKTDGFTLTFLMAITVPECPHCHKPTALASNQRYCPACGWNVEGAISAIRSSLFMMPFGTLMFVGFVLFLVYRWNFRNKYQVAIFCVVPALGILVNYISLKRALARLQALPEAVRASAAKMAPMRDPRLMARAAGLAPMFGGAAASDVAPELAEKIEPSAADQALMRTSRPREIRMSSKGKFGLAAAVLMAVGFASVLLFQLYGEWARTQSFARFQGKEWAMAAFAGLLALLPWGVWRGQVRECELLENGEIAIARVTQAWNNRDNPSIECTYQDYAGQTRRYIGTDNTQKLLQGMTVPVFYDRENPGRQVAYCSTFHEVVV